MLTRLSLSIFFCATVWGTPDWFALYTSGMEKLDRRALTAARQDLKAALRAAEGGKVEGAQRAEILHALGHVEFELGEHRASIAYHERALQLLPPSGRTADRFNIAQAYRELGNLRRAERSAREALATSPEDPRVLRLLASVLIAQRKFAEAESVARKALTKNDPAITAMVWSDLASIEEARGRNAQAAELLQQAVNEMEASHARGRALSNLSVIEQRLKRYREAVLHAQQAVNELEIHAGPRHPDLYVALERYAGALRHSGRPDEAHETAERARQLESILGATVDWRSAKK